VRSRGTTKKRKKGKEKKRKCEVLSIGMKVTIDSSFNVSRKQWMKSF
jgi:hypothetical protein